MSKEKLNKDLEFFAFCWQMMLGGEGYFIATFVWFGVLSVLLAIAVLATAGVQAVLT